MAQTTFDLADLNRRMDGGVQKFKSDLASLRTGRASANVLDPITVEAYGARTPLNQLATVSVPEPRLLSVQVWDRSMVQAVEKAIRESDIGLNPQTEGQVLRIRIPELNEHLDRIRVNRMDIERQLDEIQAQLRDLQKLEEEVRALREELRTRPFVLDALVLLPDHLHCVWTLPAGDSDSGVMAAHQGERQPRGRGSARGRAGCVAPPEG